MYRIVIAILHNKVGAVGLRCDESFCDSGQSEFGETRLFVINDIFVQRELNTFEKPCS